MTVNLFFCIRILISQFTKETWTNVNRWKKNDACETTSYSEPWWSTEGRKERENMMEMISGELINWSEEEKESAGSEKPRYHRKHNPTHHPPTTIATNSPRTKHMKTHIHHDISVRHAKAWAETCGYDAAPATQGNHTFTQLHKVTERAQMIEQNSHHYLV